MSGSQPSNQNIKPRAGASAAIFRDGAVLLVERAAPPYAGHWSLPGGAIEPGETAQAAAARELGEETGIKAEFIGLVDVADVLVEEAGQLSAHHVIAVYCGLWHAGEAKAASDAAAVRWAMADELPGIELTPGTLGVIAKAAAMLKLRQ